MRIPIDHRAQVAQHSPDWPDAGMAAPAGAQQPVTIRAGPSSTAKRRAPQRCRCRRCSRIVKVANGAAETTTYDFPASPSSPA